MNIFQGFDNLLLLKHFKKNTIDYREQESKSVLYYSRTLRKNSTFWAFMVKNKNTLQWTFSLDNLKNTLDYLENSQKD